MTPKQYAKLKVGNTVYRVAEYYGHFSDAEFPVLETAKIVRHDNRSGAWVFEGRGRLSGPHIQRFWFTSPKAALVAFERAHELQVRSAKRRLKDETRALDSVRAFVNRKLAAL